jgi:hypothetical protein
MQVLQNGADTDVYLHGAFAFRIEGVVAAAVDDSYFLFQLLGCSAPRSCDRGVGLFALRCVLFSLRSGGPVDEHLRTKQGKSS